MKNTKEFMEFLQEKETVEIEIIKEIQKRKKSKKQFAFFDINVQEKKEKTLKIEGKSGLLWMTLFKMGYNPIIREIVEGESTKGILAIQL